MGTVHRICIAGALLLALLVAAVAPATAAPGDPVRRQIGATIVGVNDNHGDSCGWYVGIQIPHVPGATGYEVEYWDGYWQRVEHSFVSHDAANDHDDRAGGGHHIGITGGWYSPPCTEDPIDTGRFSKGAKAWAVFPPNYKPKASLKVEVVVPESGAVVGQTVEATVRLTAGEAPLTGVELGGLKVLGSGAQIVGRPKATAAFSLAAGASRTFAYKVKALEAGATSLQASGTGTYKGRTVSGKGAGTLRVAREALAVTIGTAPEQVRLEVNGEGDVDPTTVEVTVKLTNTGATTLTDVQLLSLNPEPVDRTQQLDQIGLASGTLPASVGDIAAGQAATLTFPLTVTGDGRYRLRALAQATNAAGFVSREPALGGVFEVTVPPLYFTAELEDAVRSSRIVRGGQSYFVSGYVKNLSDHQNLCLRPFTAAKRGNADLNGPVDLTVYKKGEKAPPLAGGLKPGQRVPFGVWVATSNLGGTRSEVTLDVGAAKAERGESCEVGRVMKKAPLGGDDVWITPGSTEYVVSVDTSAARFPPLGVVGTLYNFGGGFLVGMGVTTGQMLQDSYALAAAVVREGTTLQNYVYAAQAGYDSVRQIEAITQAYRNMHATIAITAVWWSTLTPAEREEYLAEVRATLEKSRDQAWDGAARLSEAVTRDLMRGVTAYYADPNDPAAWRALGRQAGGITSQVAIEIAMGKASATIGAKATELASRFQAVARSSGVARSLRGIRAGKALNAEELRTLWGMTQEDIRNFSRIAREHDVVIGVRDRSPASVRHLKRGSVWKHENLKPKNVNKLDIDYLNFSGDDEGLVVFKHYTEEERAQIMFKVANANLPPAKFAELTDRMEKRFAESKKYLQDIQAFADEGEIDIGFNVTENGFENVPTAEKKRAFALDARTEKNGTVTYRPYQENTKFKPTRDIPGNCDRRRIQRVLRVVCRVTGDMDGVYIATPQGGPVDPDKLLAIYKALEEAGWQHPETLTWAVDMAKGGFWFDAKDEILRGHQVGGKALAEFSPDGIRATYLNIAQSHLLNGQTGEWFVNIVGGFQTLVK